MHLENYRTLNLIRPFMNSAGVSLERLRARPGSLRLLFLAQESDAAKEDAMLQPAIGQELR
jgi:hypothetical protein